MIFLCVFCFVLSRASRQSECQAVVWKALRTERILKKLKTSEERSASFNTLICSPEEAVVVMVVD